MKALVLTISLGLSFLLGLALPALSTEPEEISTTKSSSGLIVADGDRRPANVNTTQLGQSIVEGSQVVRVVDREFGNVCYVAHGRAVNSGVGVYCLPLVE